MWYVMQTITGKEQELADVIWRVLTGERKKYERCFVLYQEYDRRSGGKLEACIEVLFPSYVFVETDAPEEFFLELKHIPKMSRLLGAEGFFWSINKEEELFLQCMLEKSDAGYDGIEEKSDKKNAKKKTVIYYSSCYDCSSLCDPHLFSCSLWPKFRSCPNPLLRSFDSSSLFYPISHTGAFYRLSS